MSVIRQSLGKWLAIGNSLYVLFCSEGTGVCWNRLRAYTTKTSHSLCAQLINAMDWHLFLSASDNCSKIIDPKVISGNNLELILNLLGLSLFLLDHISK